MPRNTWTNSKVEVKLNSLHQISWTLKWINSKHFGGIYQCEARFLLWVGAFERKRLILNWFKRAAQWKESGSQKIGKTIFKLSMSFLKICNNRYICTHWIENMQRNEWYGFFGILIAMVKCSSDQHSAFHSFFHCCLLLFTSLLCDLSAFYRSSFSHRTSCFIFFIVVFFSHKMTRKVPHRENLNIT